jgi:hypothetical protein
MKKIICLSAWLIVFGFTLHAQDEGAIEKRERIALDKGIFIGLGPSLTLGKNIGDYSTGINFEIGYTKRLNRVLSIGPSISYLKFNYDPEKTGENNAFISDEMFSGEFYDYWVAMYVDFKGGDLSLLSAALNFKLNFIPIKDNSKISVYGFAKPFITSAQRSAVTGKAYVFGVPDQDENGAYSEDEIYAGAEFGVVEIPWEAGDPQWESLGLTISDDLKKDSRITGGIFIGPGIELFPAKKVSFYVQAAFGYTFPVSFVSTEKYKGNVLEKLDEKFPITEEGFPSVNIQFGGSFNF